MNGVEILSSETIYATDMLRWILPVFVGIGILIGFIIAIVERVDFGFNTGSIFAIFTCALIGLFIGTIGMLMSAHKTTTVDYIEYKVTIDEEVNFIEFVDKYEILGREGKIFTVRERDSLEDLSALLE